MKGRITITFEHNGTELDDSGLEFFRREIRHDLYDTVIKDFAEGGENLMGYDGPLVDGLTLEIEVEVGNERVEPDPFLDDEQGKAIARAAEYHTEEV